LVVFVLVNSHCWCSYRHQLSNLPDTRHTTQRWQSVGQNVGPALVGQAGKKKLLPFKAQMHKICVSDKNIGYFVMKLYWSE
jgi:hypothetical protein